MNKNLFLKILGIISGLLVISGLFLPYTKQSLWAIDISNNQIYLSIVIIVFALLPIIFYTINKKIEFVYTSVGALGFFITVQLVDAITKGTFSAFGLGFYFILVGIVLMGIVTIILGKKSKVNVLNEQIAPISNNIADPIERKNMDPEYSQSLDNVLPLENENTENVVEDANSNEEEIEALGEEIPEYQPENGINPVVSEFTDDTNMPQEATDTSVESSQDVSNVDNTSPESSPVDQAPVAEEVAVPTVTEDVSVAETPVASENVPQQESVGESIAVQEVVAPTVTENTPVASENVPQQEFISPATEVSTQPEVAPQQNDIVFEDAPQQEIPQETQEPQVDIFGQPK